ASVGVLASHERMNRPQLGDLADYARKHIAPWALDALLNIVIRTFPQYDDAEESALAAIAVAIEEHQPDVVDLDDAVQTTMERFERLAHTPSYAGLSVSSCLDTN